MKNKEKKFNLTDKKRKLLFYILLMAWPVLQFSVFYIGVNFNSILLAFKQVDVLDYTKYAWTFDNFRNWFADSALLKELTSAILVSLESYVIMLVVSVPLGLLFAYYIYKKSLFSGVFRVLLFLPSIISSVVLVSVYINFTDFVVPEVLGGLGIKMETALLSSARTRYATVMFYNVLVCFGTSTLMYSNKMTSISPEIIESANLDGATGFREFWNIVLPLTFPTLSVFLVTGIAGIFINQYNAFTFFGTTVYSEVQSLGYLMYVRTYTAKQNVAEYPMIAALGIMLSAVAIPLTFLVRWLLQKFGPTEEAR